MGRKDEPRVLKLINFEIWNIQKFNELLLNCWKYLSIDCWNALYLIQLSLEYSRSRDPLHLHLHHHEITREGSLDCGGHAMSGLVKYHFSSRRANWLRSYLSVEVRIRQHFSSSKVNTELTVLRSKENISTEWDQKVLSVHRLSSPPLSRPTCIQLSRTSRWRPSWWKTYLKYSLISLSLCLHDFSHLQTVLLSLLEMWAEPVFSVEPISPEPSDIHQNVRISQTSRCRGILPS